MSVNSTSTALLRRLKEFVDTRIGLHAWEKARVIHIDQQADDEEAYVQVRLTFPRGIFKLALYSSEARAPLGLIILELDPEGTHFEGPADEKTFDRVASTINAALAAA